MLDDTTTDLPVWHVPEPGPGGQPVNTYYRLHTVVISTAGNDPFVDNITAAAARLTAVGILFSNKRPSLSAIWEHGPAIF